MYGQLLLFLAVTPKNKTCLLKLKINLLENSSILSLVYLYIERFSKVYFVKPLQNQWSTEVYLVGEDYIDPLNEKELDILYESLDNYDKNSSVIDLDQVQDNIKYQLIGIIKQLIDNNIFFMRRSLYYLDYYNTKPKSEVDKEFDLIKNYVNKKNEDWIKTTKIEKLDKKYII